MKFESNANSMFETEPGYNILQIVMHDDRPEGRVVDVLDLTRETGF